MMNTVPFQRRTLLDKLPNRLDLHRNVERQAAHPNGRARPDAILLAEDLSHQIREALHARTVTLSACANAMPKLRTMGMGAAGQMTDGTTTVDDRAWQHEYTITDGRSVTVLTFTTAT